MVSLGLFWIYIFFMKHFFSKNWMDVINEKKFKKCTQPHHPNWFRISFKYKKVVIYLQNITFDNRFEVSCIRKWNNDLNEDFANRI